MMKNMDEPINKSPFSIGNVRLFIAFRVFFNARFYYPVFTILFLDFGLSLEQFALLNVAWATTIVLLEVPSGALADTFGRRNLLVFSGGLMVMEMVLICFVPMDNARILFLVFLINRILSGAAEAAASGADEALAYDSLEKEGDIRDWGEVLETQMRYQAFAFIGAMSIGAAVYDPALIQRLVDLLGINLILTQAITIRFPLYLTLVMAIITLLITLRMVEVGKIGEEECVPHDNCRKSVFEAFRVTFQAGKWILQTPFALVIIATGMLFDNIIRTVLTINSQYYRLINLPEATFGLIGSSLAALGLLIPRFARVLTITHSPAFNLGIMAFLTLIGLIGMTVFIPIFGLVPVILLYCVMFLLGYFLSHYLNRITDSRQRATVLSFKGLSFNLAYGFVGLLYSFLLRAVRSQISDIHPSLAGEALENVVFVQSLQWFPWYFGFTLVVLLIFAWWKLRSYPEYKNVG